MPDKEHTTMTEEEVDFCEYRLEKWINSEGFWLLLP